MKKCVKSDHGIFMLGLGFFCGFAAYAVINALCAPSEKDEGLSSSGSSVCKDEGLSSSGSSVCDDFDDFDFINAPWNNSY